MDTKTRKIRDFEQFCGAYKDNLLCDTNEVMKIVSGQDTLYTNLLAEFSNEAKPLLLQLMFRHYPDFKAITHSTCIEYIDRIINNHIYMQAINMYSLCRLNEENCDLCRKYSDIEKFREYYHNPPVHPLMEQDEWREYYSISDGREFGSGSMEQNKIRLFYNEWKKKRRSEYCRTVEPLLFYHLPELRDLQGDYSVMYATHRDNNYTILESGYKLLETTLDYEMPLESITFSMADWKLLQQNYLHNTQKVFEKRNARIYCGNHT